MTQITPNNLMRALLWIHTNPHFEVGTEYSKDGMRATHTFYRNHFDKLRVKIAADWSSDFHRLIRPNPRPHDDRMFSLTRQGKIWLRVWAHSNDIDLDWKNHP